MAITFVDSTEAQAINVSSLTLSVTIPAGDDRLLVVAVGFSVISGAMPTISTVTYGGQSLSKTDGAAANMTVENVDDTRKTRSEIWKIVAPNVGTNNVVITLSAAIAHLNVVASWWTGVDQTTPLGTAATAQSDGASSPATATVDVSSASGEVVVDSMMVLGDSGSGITSLAVGASQTEIESSLNRGGFGSSRESGAATTTMSWTITDESPPLHWAIVGVPLKAASTTSPDVSANTTITEIALVEHRGAPSGFSPTGAVAENQQAQWAAAGVYPSVFRLHFVDEEPVWDQVYTLSSVAPAAKIVVSAVSCPASPNGSLFVATQDALFQYPLLYAGEQPTIAEFADLANGGNDLLPAIYPSAVRVGDGLYRLIYIECYGTDFIQDTDAWGFAFKWDETNPWSAVELKYDNNALYKIMNDNVGTVLHTAFSIYDAGINPVAPAGRRIIAWVEKVDRSPHAISQPERLTTETY